jgi:agmatinase
LIETGGKMMNRFLPRDALISPRFAGVPTFMRLPVETDPRKLDVALVGVPFDGGTTYRNGARFGPREIRVQSTLIRNYNPVLQINPFKKIRVADFGDIDVNPLSIEDTFHRIQQAIKNIVEAGARPLSIGGDHSISLPILRALAREYGYGQLGLIHLDSHTDTWDEYFGMKLSHGTSFRRAIEENLLDPHKIIQIGVRGQLYDEKDFNFNRRHGVRMIPIEDIFEQGIAFVSKKMRELAESRIYLSFDIDVVDPAYAPGTGTPQVGGLTSFQAIQLIRDMIELDFVGCDLVEVSPPYDSANITSLLAANLMFEILCVLSKSIN